MDLDLEQKIYLALCWHRTNKDKPIQTTDRWVFILFGRTEESFLNVLKMKSVFINFYIRYEKGSFQDEEGTVETLKGYILFYRDVTKTWFFHLLQQRTLKNMLLHFMACVILVKWILHIHSV